MMGYIKALQIMCVRNVRQPIHRNLTHKPRDCVEQVSRRLTKYVLVFCFVRSAEHSSMLMTIPMVYVLSSCLSFSVPQINQKQSVFIAMLVTTNTSPPACCPCRRKLCIPCFDCPWLFTSNCLPKASTYDETLKAHSGGCCRWFLISDTTKREKPATIGRAGIFYRR